MYERILAPIDGSPTSLRGLDEAIALAKNQRALLRLLNVVDESVIAMDPSGMMAWHSVLETLRQGGRKVLEDAKTQATQRGVEVQTKLIDSLPGSVWRCILEEASAWRADLIVMGTHGRRGMTRLILGSDAQAVLQGANVPVLLVRGPANTHEDAMSHSPSARPV